MCLFIFLCSCVFFVFTVCFFMPVVGFVGLVCTLLVRLFAYRDASFSIWETTGTVLSAVVVGGAAAVVWSVRRLRNRASSIPPTLVLAVTAPDRPQGINSQPASQQAIQPFPSCLPPRRFHPYARNPLRKRFFVGCSSPFMRLSEHVMALRACWKRCLPGR